MARLNQDPVLHAFRKQIAELDLQILETLNSRVSLVKHIKDYKASQGLGFHDAAQEDRLVAALSQANPGPLSREGLNEIFRLILEWTKRDAMGPDGETPTD